MVKGKDYVRINWVDWDFGRSILRIGCSVFDCTFAMAAVVDPVYYLHISQKKGLTFLQF